MSLPERSAVASGDSTVSAAEATANKPKKATADDFIFGKIIGEGSFSTVRMT